MAWHTSRRRESLPPDWAKRRRECIRRAGGICEHRTRNGIRCKREATDADHRTHRDNHDDLQALCSEHHKQKTQREARAAQNAKYMHARKRTPEQHPGIRPGGTHVRQTTPGGTPLRVA